MLSATDKYTTLIDSPVRSIKCDVLLYGTAIIDTIGVSIKDTLKSFDIQRVGEGKFFGFGICHRLNIKLIDINNSKNLKTKNYFKIGYGDGESYFYPYPSLYVSEVHRDEINNEVSVTAYDLLHQASKHTVNELELTSYTIKEFAEKCATLLGIKGVEIINVSDSSFNTSYETGANFEGTETIREALDAVAEVTQTIYYINNSNKLVFKRLDKDGNAVLSINKDKYFDLDSGTNRRLATITHATELGDNVSASTTESGSTQFVRDNPFWDMREDVATLVDNALTAVGGLTINQFECEWRGNFLLEIGDKISLTKYDNSIVNSYVLDDEIEYNGIFSEKTRWSYEDNEDESESNPTNIGDAIKKTYARVDKVNKEIQMVASETNNNSEKISSLELNTDGILATVTKVQDNVNTSINNINEDVQKVTEKVELAMTSEEVDLKIKSELDNGVTKVETNTGFTFNDEGLTVEKSNSEMKTQITEDGMKVYKNDDAVLVANNVGVDAINLHATTYLIIGTNSRFEDYDTNRTGCFWIGG